MRIAIFTEIGHALGRIHRSLKARLEAEGHTVHMYDWSQAFDIKTLQHRFLTYDRVLSTSLITSCRLFDMTNVHIRSRIIAVAHIGVKNNHFREIFAHVSCSTPVAAAGGVSLDTLDFFASTVSQPMVYLPCGVEPLEFVVRPPPRHIRRLGFVGTTEHNDAYKAVKRPDVFLEVCRLSGCEPVFIFGQPSTGSLFDNIDMLICTSAVEGGPLGIFEAAAAGIPVLSTRVGNVARLQHVMFFQTPDEAALLIHKLNADEATLISYARAVTAEVRSRFNWDTLYTNYWRPLFQGETGSQLNFLEIGTSDFDTCIQTCLPDARGISVEPVGAYFNRLPSKPGVTKLNQAVSDFNGDIPVFYISPQTITDLNLAECCRGCNSVNKPHPYALQELRRVLGTDASEDDILSKFHTDTVRVTDFETLTEEQNVRAIDFLKIDTEGHDCTIMRSVLKACLKKRSLFPRKIRFETNELAAQEEVDVVVAAFEAEGYSVARGDNTTLTRMW